MSKQLPERFDDAPSAVVGSTREDVEAELKRREERRNRVIKSRLTDGS